MAFFEGNPAVFVVAVIAIVEAWLRVREPLLRHVRLVRLDRDTS